MSRGSQYLSWVYLLTQTPVAQRRKIRDHLIEGIRAYRKSKEPREGSRWLSDLLEEERDLDLIGFSVEVEYIKMEGPKDQLGCVWRHPWGTPQLLYKHKRLPMLIIVGPGIRFNESVLEEVNPGSDSDIRGITG